VDSVLVINADPGPLHRVLDEQVAACGGCNQCRGDRADGGG
jgi:hypothetical protein